MVIEVLERHHIFTALLSLGNFPHLPQNLKQKIDKTHLPPLALKKFLLKSQNVFL